MQRRAGIVLFTERHQNNVGETWNRLATKLALQINDDKKICQEQLLFICKNIAAIAAF
jgi:hypothetical protein